MLPQLKITRKNKNAEIVATTHKATELNIDLHNRYKRKARDYDVEVEDIKRSRKDRPKFKMSNIEMDQMLNIQKRWGDLILKCLPEKTQMSISLGGGPDSAGRCYKTTVTKTYTNKMICKTCTGQRAGQNVLDNYKGAGVRILLADQFAPSTLCDSGEMCTAVLRYSNSTLADFTEYMLLPMVKEGLNHTTGDANGFIELVSQAMKVKLEIHCC